MKNTDELLADDVITSSQMVEFARLFQVWRDSYPTCDQIEMGGPGELDDLAPKVLRWARSIRGDTSPG